MSETHHDDVLTILVVRTGGFAGRRREWQVGAGADDADSWIVLIDRCPWDASEDEPGPGPNGEGPAVLEAAPERPRPTPSPRPGATPTPAPGPTPAPAPAPAPAAPADRFVWSIRVRTPEQRLEQVVPETALVGPWRDLVDAVRSAD